MRVLLMAAAAVMFTLAGLWGVSTFAAESPEAAVVAPPGTRSSESAIQDGALASLGWLAGCWQWHGGGGALTGEEQWMAPAGGMMLGMSRTRRGDRVVEHEFLRIADRDGVLHFIANPSGQAEAAFRAVSVADTMTVFENPQHDFPQRITYRRAGTDSLVATISAIAQGTRPPLSFRMARVACP